MNKIVFSPIEPNDLINQIKESIKLEFSALKKELLKNNNSDKDLIDSDSNELISLEDTATFFNVGKTTIHYWRKQQILPPIYRKGRRVYFKKQELIRSLESLPTK